MKKLLQDDEQLMKKLIHEIKYLSGLLGDPPIEVLLALKDELQISDDQWCQVRKLISFHLKLVLYTYRKWVIGGSNIEPGLPCIFIPYRVSAA